MNTRFLILGSATLPTTGTGNRMLADGSELLLVVPVQNSAGSYPYHVLGNWLKELLLRENEKQRRIASRERKVATALRGDLCSILKWLYRRWQSKR